MRKQRGARKTLAEAERIAAGFEASELTRAAYAEMHGITVAALDGYRRRVRQRSAGFVEIAVGDIASRETFAIELASGLRVEIGWADIERAPGQASHLRRMIETLDREQPCSG